MLPATQASKMKLFGVFVFSEYAKKTFSHISSSNPKVSNTIDNKTNFFVYLCLYVGSFPDLLMLQSFDYMIIT